MSADLEALQRAFDESFAAPVTREGGKEQDLIAIGVGERALAVRLGEITRLEPLRRPLAVPNARPELLGLAASQDRLYALFSLAALLGQAPGPDQGAGEARWQMLLAGEQSVALAFTRFEGLIRAGQDAISRAASAEGSRPLVPELVRVGQTVRGVLDLRAVVDAIGPVDRGRQ
jgi:chemotaxis signal transduction protein